ncbi:MAG: Hpt domain-containing protein, partial [Pseudomonadales bacterium]|nr:Hpt domain-containing protein [Pseudomonadales bacterium]
ILEIFSEEAEEVLEVLQRETPLWVDDGNESSLDEIRRGFHTLKGSGRMVNATQIAELAWPIEQMLNRLIEGSVVQSAALSEVVCCVTEILPQMIEAFNARQLLADPRIKGWADTANKIANGDAVEIGSVRPTITAPTETAESVSEASNVHISIEPVIAPSLIEVFADECREHLDAIRLFMSNPEAINEQVSRALHTLKGSAGAVDLFAIARISGTLEPLFSAQDARSQDCEPALLTLLNNSIELIEAIVGQPDGPFNERIAAFFLQVEQFLAGNQSAEIINFDLPIDDGAGAPEQPSEEIRALLLDGMDCLSACNQTLEQWRVEGIDEAAHGALITQIRELSSLASSTKTTSVIDINAVLIEVFEALDTEIPLADDTYQQITNAQEALFHILDTVAMGQQDYTADPVVEQLTELRQQLADAAAILLAEPIQTPVIAADAGNEPDAETLTIFFDEARELSLSIELAINSWFSEPNNELYPQELLRHLHTLKGGARITGLENLASFSHDFESFLTQIIPISGDFDTQSRHRLGDLLNQLIERVDNLSETGTAGKDITPPVVTAITTLKTENTETADEGSLATDAANPSHTEEAISGETQGQSAADQDAHSSIQNAKSAAKSFTRVSTDLLESLVNLAGESSISRARTEQQVGAFSITLDEMEITLERLRNQIRQVDVETQNQPKRRSTDSNEGFDEDFDPLEMDRYSGIQQLARGLMESTSDLIDLKESLVDTTKDAETTLLQQSRIHSELQSALMRTRMVPFSKMVPRIRRVIRQTAEELSKPVQITVTNAEVEIDRAILDRMIPALEHMLRNAVDHGLETPPVRQKAGKPATGTISLIISRDGGDMLIEVSDDGQGVDIDALRKKAIEHDLMSASDPLADHQILQFILHSGISTAQSVTQISGRGVGLNVVNSEIKQLGGSVHIESQRGIGTRFVIRLPFTVSVTRALMTRTAGEQFAIPLNAIEGIVRVSPYELQTHYQPDAPNFEYAGQSYEVCYMGSLLDSKQPPNLQGLSAPMPVILARSGDRALAIQVDTILGSHEIVVKPLGPQFLDVQGFSGATILGDGSVVVILDLSTLIRGHQTNAEYALESQDDPLQPKATQVMVVDDSVTVRKVTSRLLTRHAMSVSLAKDGADAIEKLHEHRPDVILLDIEMPKMDGFEVARVIRHTEGWKDIPIIMISSRTGSKHRDKALSIGVDRFIGKPFQEADLLDNIRQLTGHAEPLSGDTSA